MVELKPHFRKDSHQVQKNHLHFHLHHQLLNILPPKCLHPHPYRNLKDFHQGHPGQLGC